MSDSGDEVILKKATPCLQFSGQDFSLTLDSAFTQARLDKLDCLNKILSNELKPLQFDEKSKRGLPDLIISNWATGVNGRVKFLIDDGKQDPYSLFATLDHIKPANYIDEDSQQVITGPEGKGGIKGFAPWPQDAWSNLLPSRQNWPPDMTTSRSQISLEKSDSDPSLRFMHPVDTEAGKAYGTKPVGFFKLDNTTQTAWVGFQQTIQDEKFYDSAKTQPIKLAPWTIAPFLIPKNAENDPEKPSNNSPKSPNALTVFPYSASDEQIANEAKTDPTFNERWNKFESNDQSFMLVNHGVTGELVERKLNGASTNWSLFAKENSNYLVLNRTAAQHDDQFQIYFEPYGLYVELEWTGPLVSGKDKTSTVMTQIQLVPVKALINKESLGEGDEFKNNMQLAAKALQKKLEE